VQRLLLLLLQLPMPLCSCASRFDTHTLTVNCLSPCLLPQGYVFGVVSALLSAVAAVYTEWVLKKNNDTLYWQNMLLYGFGSVFNLANLAHRCMPRASTPCCCGCVPALSR
jgi:hypothetical protein